MHVLAPHVLVGVRADGVAARAAQNESDSYRKMFLRVEDVQGRNCLTNFWVRPPALRLAPSSQGARCTHLTACGDCATELPCCSA